MRDAAEICLIVKDVASDGTGVRVYALLDYCIQVNYI